MDFDPERIARSPFLIGGLGALVALRGAPGETWPTRVFNVISGALFAGFVGPGYGISTKASVKAAKLFAAY